MKKHYKLVSLVCFVCLLSIGSYSLLHLHKAEGEHTAPSHKIMLQSKRVASKGATLVVNKILHSVQYLLTR